jgi:hypothetical protein
VLNASSGQPADPIPPVARNFNQEGLDAAESADPNAAAKDFFNAVLAAPWYPDAYFGLAGALADLTLYAQALTVERRYLVLAPDGAQKDKANALMSKWEALGVRR